MVPYKYRIAESNIKPELVEKLQGGILMRFGIKKLTQKNENDPNAKITMFRYAEFWFDPKTGNMADIVKSKGFSLTKTYVNLLNQLKI